MLHFTTESPFFRHSGVALLLFQLWVFIWALPPFQAGIWLQTEPIVFALFACAALNALWIGAGITCGWLIVEKRPHVLWLCLFAWVGWQVLATLVAGSPWRSWFGPPQTGDGAALSLAMLLTIMQAHALWHAATARRAIVIIAIAALLAQAGLHTVYYKNPDNFFIPGSWVPAVWPEYLPFMGGYVWIMLFAGGYIRNRRQHVMLLAFMAALLFVSWNKSAVILFSAAIAASAFIALVPLPPALRRFLEVRKSWRVLFMLACVLPMTMVAVSEMLPSLSVSSEAGGIGDKNRGIGARMVLNQVAVATLKAEPGRWFMGDGWGRFPDDLFKCALVDGVHVFHDGKREPNWFLVDGSTYHAHSQPLETLLSLGLPGMVLWYALPMLMLWALPRHLFWACAPMLVALVALSHLWMQLPQCMPYQGLFLAAMLAVCANPGPARMQKAWPAATCLLIALVMAWSAQAQWSAMQYGHTLQNALRTGSHKDYSEEWLMEDFRRGGDRWAASVIFYSKDAAAAAARGETDDNMQGWYGYLLHTAHQAAVSPRMGARASSMELRLQYYLFGGFDDPRFRELRHETALDFENAAMRFTYKAPLRDDYTSFFLINLGGYTNDDPERQKQILRRMLLIAPEHRGALWMLGYMFSRTPGHEEEGREMLEKAARLHVEDVLPVASTDLAPYLKTE